MKIRKIEKKSSICLLVKERSWSLKIILRRSDKLRQSFKQRFIQILVNSFLGYAVLALSYLAMYQLLSVLSLLSLLLSTQFSGNG